MVQRFITLLSILAFFGSSLSAQVNWSYKAAATGSNSYEITFTAEVEAGWYIYSQYIGDDGPVPTTFEFNKANEVQLVGKMSEAGYKKAGYDEIFGMDLIKFGKTVTFVQKVQAKKGTTISGYLTFMTCNDEQCLPPKDIEFELVLP